MTQQYVVIGKDGFFSIAVAGQYPGYMEYGYPGTFEEAKVTLANWIEAQDQDYWIEQHQK